MRAHRPDRVIRALTALVSVAYFAVMAGAVVGLVAGPALKLFAGNNPEWIWGLSVPATVLDAEATVRTRWGAARLVVSEARGDLRMPISMLPWWLVGVLWVHAATVFALVLLSLHSLRRVFQRVRDGAPFDARNALQLRWLGLLLLALAAFNAVAELVTSAAVRRGLAGGSVGVPAGLHVDPTAVFVALGLVALGEVFRRGADMETEQSLTV